MAFIHDHGTDGPFPWRIILAVIAALVLISIIAATSGPSNTTEERCECYCKD